MSTTHFNSHKLDRIDIRLSHETKQRIEKAAELDHRSITSFIIDSAVKSAEKLLKRSDRMTLSDRDWDVFYNALNNPPKPNEKLRSALLDYNKLNIKSDV